MKNLSLIHSRRNLFKLGATSLVIISAGLSTGCDFFETQLSIEQRLIQSLHHLERAQEIGNAFRSQSNTSSFNSLENITEQLLEWLNLDRIKIQNLSDKKLIQHLSHQIRNDFMNENTVVIDKWMFSKTEALICALAAVYQNSANNK